MTGIVAALLAAGASSRTAPDHKLMACDSSGTAMLTRSAAGLLASDVSRVLVLLPPMASALVPCLTGLLPVSDRLSVHCVPAGRYELSATVGYAAALAERLSAAGLLILPGDMPLVKPETTDRIIGYFMGADVPPDSVAPVCDRKTGHPVLWHARRLGDLQALTGDRGARALLRDPALIHGRVAADESVLADFDTPERLALFATL
ncbi:NTP transferase domain-containing protein [Acetobacter sp. AN02]|uniref:nucleotidyltransferase family protein n=1 Tax=Acetobacter sp. AN02 TaxID=2894186 RepID=UPI0024340DA9|nr:NTP transferase domain-containing protein [Acetobacter sp. AN02]MDG6095659.1 NTP transferase domain-containing protein [Acetobacter sp. AN02]